MIGERGGWKIDFDPSSARLVLSHDSGADVSGELVFRQEDAAWRVDFSRDGVEDRLALVDREGDVQGYLNFVVQGSRLEVLVHHRAAQSYGGMLHFQGDAILGRSSFACRVTAPVGELDVDDLTVTADQVVQLASGPADSGLNDALFDVATDVALRFGGATVDLNTERTGQNETSVFALLMTGRVDDASCSALIFELIPDYFRSRYIPYYTPINRARCPRPPTGWMSWNVYFDQASAAENLAEARIGSTQLRPFGLEIWSIESWQGNSDRLPVSNFHLLDLSAHEVQFPAGMKRLADDIRELGFRPGIWTAPFGTGNAVFYAEHCSWFLHDDQGEPFRNWCGRYLLDPSQPEVREHMRKMHRVMQEEWGYEFFKIDGMSGRHHSYSAHAYERDEMRRAMRDDCPNPFERCVQALREGIGADSIFLACQGHYTGPEAGLVDAVRIGADIVAPNQASTWNNILSQARATLNQLFVHNIAFYNDPDTLLVGAYHPLEQARVTTTVVALPGQITFAGDKLGELASERMRLLQQSLPVCEVRPLDLFPVYTLQPVWDLKIRRSFGAWDVVALFNWQDEERRVRVGLRELGLDPAIDYVGWELWTGAYLDVVAEGLEMPVPSRSVRIVALHRRSAHPQFLGTDRHVTQGGVSLRECRWTGVTLEVEVELVGGHEFAYYFRVPQEYYPELPVRGMLKDGSAVPLTVACDLADQVLTLRVCSQESGVGKLELRFAR